MLNFYDGIDYTYLGQGSPRKFTRQVFLAHYCVKNQDAVCSGCDAGKIEGIEKEQPKRGKTKTPASEGHVYADIDHFLPKSSYPLLAIHPLNLTPYCKRCNQAFKKSTDALNNDRHPNLGPSGIYHPYLRPACAEVAIVVERDATGKERVRLQSIAQDAVSLARLDSLRPVFKLQQRWQDRLQQQTLQKNVRMHLLSAFVHLERPDQSPDLRGLLARWSEASQ